MNDEQFEQLMDKMAFHLYAAEAHHSSLIHDVDPPEPSYWKDQWDEFPPAAKWPWLGQAHTNYGAFVVALRPTSKLISDILAAPTTFAAVAVPSGGPEAPQQDPFPPEDDATDPGPVFPTDLETEPDSGPEYQPDHEPF